MLTYRFCSKYELVLRYGYNVFNDRPENYSYRSIVGSPFRYFLPRTSEASAFSIG
jgi:hypothetical protein